MHTVLFEGSEYNLQKPFTGLSHHTSGFLEVCCCPEDDGPDLGPSARLFAVLWATPLSFVHTCRISLFSAFAACSLKGPGCGCLKDSGFLETQSLLPAPESFTPLELPVSDWEYRVPLECRTPLIPTTIPEDFTQTRHSLKQYSSSQSVQSSLRKAVQSLQANKLSMRPRGDAMEVLCKPVRRQGTWR